MKTTIVLSLLAISALAPVAAAADKPDLPPLVGVCVDDVTAAGCYDDAWICVGFSYQIPACVDHLDVVCTEICNPCGPDFLDCSSADVQAGPRPECMDVYNEYDFGGARIVSRNSCSAEVYVNDEPVLG